MVWKNFSKRTWWVVCCLVIVGCNVHLLDDHGTRPQCIVSGWKLKWPARVRKIQPFWNLVPPVVGLVTSEFGVRNGRCHYGVDIAAPKGAAIHAVFDGVVVYSGRKGSFGRVVIIDHQNGYYSLYAHNKKNKARQGDVVTKGQIIAWVGSSGRSTGPHMHLEIRQKNRSLDPLAFLDEQYFVFADR